MKTGVGNARIFTMSLTVLAALVAAGMLGAVAGRPAEAAFPGGNGMITFASDRETGAHDIFTISPTGGTTDRLTSFTTGHNIDPAVSPDGSRIAFIRDGQIWVMKTDGTGAVRITETPPPKTNPTWSPDGSRLAYASNSSDLDGQSDLEIWAINADGSGRTQLTSNTVTTDNQPAWSPDGTRIAFVSARSGDTNRNIYLMNSSGSGTAVSLTANSSDPLYQGHDDHPSWSPDGSRIAYSNNGDGDADIYKMDANPATKDWVNLTNPNSPGLDVEPAWSPDGTKIAYIATSGSTGPNIHVMNAGAPGSGAAIDSDTADDESPDWQPNPPTCDVSGDGNANTLNGTTADETICGGSGNDVINGGGGDDVIMGGDGNDKLVAPSGRGTLNGGAGSDAASFAGSTTSIQASLLTGFAQRTNTNPIEGAALVGIEGLTGSGLADDLIGSNAANILVGGTGADELLGLGGKDKINSRDGVQNDTVNGGAGTDRCTTDRREVSIRSCE